MTVSYRVWQRHLSVEQLRLGSSDVTERLTTRVRSLIFTQVTLKTIFDFYFSQPVQNHPDV